ncbi:MAG: flagellar motor switch protein FliN [Candidatus Hydrogenedentes bacterium]|nr:flagellar motor switch protein FliN [Candidatus Hydrogenedentota bacterium]
MSLAVHERFARGYLSGFFDVISAMTARPVPNAVAGVKASGVAELTAHLARFNALIRAGAQPGGSIAVALAGADANRIVAAALGRGRSDDSSIAGHDPAELKEVFDPCLGGGVGYFKEKHGIEIVLREVEVLPCGPDIAAGLHQFLGAGSYAAEFSFSLEDGHDGAGIFLFSHAVSDAASIRGENQVAESMSQDEISALTQASALNALGQESAGDSAFARRAESKNMEMVLDIRLTATARLGRVEMPIADILGLGPGSIIEVGHLVDEPVELLVNDKLIARGDVVVVDEKFGLRITEIISTRERIESLR